MIDIMSIISIILGFVLAFTTLLAAKSEVIAAVLLFNAWISGALGILVTIIVLNKAAGNNSGHAGGIGFIQLGYEILLGMGLGGFASYISHRNLRFLPPSYLAILVGIFGEVMIYLFNRCRILMDYEVWVKDQDGSATLTCPHILSQPSFDYLSFGTCLLIWAVFIKIMKFPILKNSSAINVMRVS